SAAGAHQPRHLDDGADSAACARTAYRTVAKSLDKPRDVLTVKAARRHHDDATIAPPISSEKDAVVPEDVDRKSAVFFRFVVVVPTDDLEARSQSDELYKQIKHPIGSPNLQPIQKRIVCQISKFVRPIELCI